MVYVPYVTAFVSQKKSMGPPNLQFLEVFIVNNLVFKWTKPLFFMVLGAHGMYPKKIHVVVFLTYDLSMQVFFSNKSIHIYPYMQFSMGGGS